MHKRACEKNTVSLCFCLSLGKRNVSFEDLSSSLQRQQCSAIMMHLTLDVCSQCHLDHFYGSRGSVVVSRPWIETSLGGKGNSGAPASFQKMLRLPCILIIRLFLIHGWEATHSSMEWASAEDWRVAGFFDVKAALIVRTAFGVFRRWEGNERWTFCGGNYSASFPNQNEWRISYIDASNVLSTLTHHFP